MPRPSGRPYHLFQPLNYQVATAAPSPDEIAEPLRTIFRRDRNVRVLLGEVTERTVEVQARYDRGVA